MKLCDMIKEQENGKIVEVLTKNGFIDFWNEYAPTSRFFTKNIDGNMTLYVRRDYKKYRNNDTYSFEIWIRDNNKNILDKNVDTNRKSFQTVSSFQELIAIVESNFDAIK